MKLATFLPPGSAAPRAGEVRGDDVFAFEGTVLDRLVSGDRTPARGEAFPLADVTLLAPVPRPRAIFGIGLNYRAHAEEPMAISDRVAAVALDVEDIQDHGQPRFEILEGVRWRWTDPEAEARDDEIREALRAVAARLSSAP